MEALDIHGMFAMFASKIFIIYIDLIALIFKFLVCVFSVIILTLFFTPRNKTTSRSSSISSVCETIKV